ncbi:MAG: hypothetical protein WCA35_11575 [Kovacikia sp.]
MDWLENESEEFQTVFLELYRLSKGWRFWVVKGIAAIQRRYGASTVTAVMRGWLTIRRQRGNSFIVSTNYHQWAAQLGSEFGTVLFNWLLANQMSESEQERFEQHLIKSQPGERQPLAQAVICQFKQRVKLEFLSKQRCLTMNA